MEIYNYINSKEIKLDLKILKENEKLIESIFRDYEKIIPTIEKEKGYYNLKLNGQYITKVTDNVNKYMLSNLYVDQDCYFDFDVLKVKYYETGE
ncbi:hypothetical protein ACM3BL_10165 [Mammaliicoccus sciuri]|uniref:hypothetical protein n=1 Tax=Mammaliicoccus sciuri TaxID=1296 RepID=UPI000734884A|nr:hypothetical protein [Mammaliicoccus sciuri]KTT79870.1 hypothetical protein NS202_12130 [Mammaliicoccus sciuri]